MGQAFFFAIFDLSFRGNILVCTGMSLSYPSFCLRRFGPTNPFVLARLTAKSARSW